MALFLMVAETKELFDVTFEEASYELGVGKALEFYNKYNDLDTLKHLVLLHGDISGVNTLTKLKCIELLFKVSLVDVLIKKYNCNDAEEFFSKVKQLKFTS